MRKGEGGRESEEGRGSKGARGCECRPKHKDMWLVGYTFNNTSSQALVT